MGKGELSDQGPGIQCVPARDPKALLGTSARIRENPGVGADSSLPLPLRTVEPAEIQAVGGWLGAGLDQPPANRANWHHHPDLSGPQFPCV